MSLCSRIIVATCLYLFGGLVLCGAIAGGEVVYVDAEADGANTGASWTDAFTDLQDALTAAAPGDEIWVAAGVYKPVFPVDPGNVTQTERQATFHLLYDVAIYGGFAGGETSITERDWEMNVTVLSGDIDDNDVTNEHGIVADPDDIVGVNSYTVVTGTGSFSNEILDGFFVTGGDAGSTVGPWTVAEQSGGGMYIVNGNATLANLVFIGNSANARGGGMFSYSDSSPMLTNVTFAGNRAAHGGGIFNSVGSDPVLTDVFFIGNSANFGGGGMSNSEQSLPTLLNVAFIENMAQWGGGLANSHASFTLTDVMLVDNSAIYGGGIDNEQGSPELTDVVFAGNHAAFYGGGMLNTQESNPTLTNIRFEANWAERGGGMINWDESSPVLANVVFSGNYASARGGGMENSGNNSPRLTNVTFSGNASGSTGGAIHNASNSSPILENVIIWANQSNGSISASWVSISNQQATPYISYSLIANSGGSSDWVPELGEDGGNNIDVDPLFMETPDPSDAPSDVGDLHVHAVSPAIDIGNNNFVGDVDYDLDGNPRIFGGTVDLGPYEAEYVFLYVAVQGNGLVNSDPDQGRFLRGETVTLSAVPEPGWMFAGWSGDVGGNDNPLQIKIEEDTSITAIFEQVEYTFEIETIGDGTVSVEPEQPTYHYGDEVTLTPVPETGWIFAGWSGDVDGSANPLQIVIESDTSIVASFEQAEYTVNIETVGNGTVLVKPDQFTYHYGDEVTLTPVPEIGWIFIGWQGNIPMVALYANETATVGDMLTITVENNLEIQAEFRSEELFSDRFEEHVR